MGRHRHGNDVTVVLDASNTNPLCPACGVRTFALDDVKVACRQCGEVTSVESRAAALARRAFAVPATRSGG